MAGGSKKAKRPKDGEVIDAILEDGKKTVGQITPAQGVQALMFALPYLKKAYNKWRGGRRRRRRLWQQR